MEEFFVIFVVFFIPTGIAWYLLRSEVMNHFLLFFLYAGAMVLLLYMAKGIVVTADHSAEETVGKVLDAYVSSGGSLAGALIGAGLGWVAGEIAFERNGPP